MAREPGSIRWHRGGWELSWHEGPRRRFRRFKAPNTRTGRRQAEAELERLLVTAGEPTVAEVIEDYRKSKWHSWSPSTRANWPSNSKAVLAAFTDRAACDLTPAHIERTFAEWMTDGASAATVRRRAGILSAAMIRAERLGIVAVAPTRRVQTPTPPDGPPPDLPDVTAVLRAIQNLPEGSWLRAAARLTIATGMRRGELCGLRWSDLDFDDACIWVRGAVVVDETGALVRKATKSKRASAAEALDEGTLDVLEQWRHESQTIAARLGVRWAATWPLFGAARDPSTWMDPGRATQAWLRSRDRAGLVGVRWHDLRHINASELVAAGIDPSTVARRLGHDPAMLLGRYAHARPVGDRDAADVIAAADERATMPR